MITKLDIVTDAFEEMEISGITSKPNPDQITSAIKRLDRLVLGWQNNGICLSYIRSESEINPNQDSGLNDTSQIAVVLALAVSLCPSYGKPAHPETKSAAYVSYQALFSTELTQRQADPYQPTGSGGRFHQSYLPRYQASEPVAPDGCSTQDIKIGETDFFPVNFNPDANEIAGDYIDSFSVEYGEGIEVISSAESENVISLECKGIAVGLSEVKVTVTYTPSGRVNPETINFNVIDK